jgi:hypothetical protein
MFRGPGQQVNFSEQTPTYSIAHIVSRVRINSSGRIVQDTPKRNVGPSVCSGERATDLDRDGQYNMRFYR